MTALPASSEPAGADQRRTVLIQFAAVAALWLLAVMYGARSGFLASLHPPVIGALVALSIVLPTLWYALSPAVRGLLDAGGQRPLMLLHIWRIPAALVFFWYGAQGLLPPTFWILAGIGDFIAGSLALVFAFRPESARRYLTFHLFGFADFIVAVGTGLTFTLLLDQRMAPVAELPFALIPLFGVGVSGTSHLIAFDMLRRRTGLQYGREPL